MSRLAGLPGAITPNTSMEFHFGGAPNYTQGCTWQVWANVSNWKGYTSSVTTTGVMN